MVHHESPLLLSLSPTSTGLKSEEKLLQFSPSSAPTSAGYESFATSAENDRLFKCSGCGQHILDRYYLLALNRRWHASCLKCSDCNISLDSQASCFTRNGQIYCKPDYYRSITKKCCRCNDPILPPDLVIRLQTSPEDQVYHVPCFTCVHCNITLSQGDYFGLSPDGKFIFCKNCHFNVHNDHHQHYHHHENHSSVPNQLLQTMFDLTTNNNNVTSPPPVNHTEDLSRSTIFSPSDNIVGHHFEVENNQSEQEQVHQQQPTQIERNINEQTKDCEETSFGRKKQKNNSKVTTQKKKQYKKRTTAINKSLLPIENECKLMSTLNCVLNDGQMSRNQEEDEEKEKMQTTTSFASSDFENSNFLTTTSIDQNNSSNCNNQLNNGLNGNQITGYCIRNKRMRTSFKHHQLKQMKQYFAINHNPDSKELKGLSLKTGLSKRVLQVWFQNARAKWRRSVLRQESNGPHIVSEATSLLDIDSDRIIPYNDSQGRGGSSNDNSDNWFFSSPSPNNCHDGNVNASLITEHFSVDSSSSTDILCEDQQQQVLNYT